jgi:uncharacterized membrane protein
LDDVTIARGLLVLAIVHWIGGTSLVTLVILPAARRLAEAGERLAIGEAIEGRFSNHAQVSVGSIGVS